MIERLERAVVSGPHLDKSQLHRDCAQLYLKPDPDGRLKAAVQGIVERARAAGNTHTQAHALQEAERARRVADEAAQARHRFLSSMSHELRPPLHGILGPLELLEDTPLSHQQAELIGIMKRSAELGLGVVNDILDIGKLESGRLELASDPLDLTELLDDAVTLVAERAQRKGLALHVHTAPGVPATLAGDRLRLAQVLVNLLSNAVKFTNTGHVALSISQDSHSHVVFEIQDTGCGMDAADLATIFDPYRQARHRPSGVEGTGLGLSICQGLVEAMAGTIHVESARGQGTTFRVIMLLTETWASSIPHRAASQSLAVFRILAADDNPINRQVLELTLQSLDADATMVADGVDVLEAVAQSRFDVILLDFHMAVMGGLQTASALQAMGVATPLVALTASALQEDQDAAKHAGMVGFVSQPFTRAMLSSELQRVLQAVQPSAATG